MKRQFSAALTAAILCVGCAAAPFPAQAQMVEPMQTPTIQQETTLSLTGEGKVETAPDIAMVSLGVSVDAATASAAMKQQAQQMNGVFSALKKSGVAEKDMQTGNISLSPRYDYSSRRESPPKLIGYNASNTVTAKIRDLDNLGKVLDAVVEAGGNTINSINFSVDDASEIMKEARSNAVKDALDKAELYASAAGYQVSRIITIDEAGMSAPRPMAAMRMAADMAESAPTPIAAGEVTHVARVSVTFELTR